MPQKKITTPTAKINTTTQNGKKLAWLALKHKVHANGVLKDELLNYLWDHYDHAVAMTFVDGDPACVVMAAEYGQLMAYTKRKYRRMGLAKRTSQALCRQLGVRPEDFNGAGGKRPQVSEAFFRHMGVVFVK